jgi:hypothetical protein
VDRVAQIREGLAKVSTAAGAASREGAEFQRAPQVDAAMSALVASLKLDPASG